MGPAQIVPLSIQYIHQQHRVVGNYYLISSIVERLLLLIPRTLTSYPRLYHTQPLSRRVPIQAGAREVISPYQLHRAVEVITVLVLQRLGCSSDHCKW